MVSGTTQNYGRSVFVSVFSIVAFWSCGCRVPQPPSAPPGSMPLYLDEDRMRTEVLQHVQIGMPVDDAKKVMERHGFECRVDETSKSFTPDFATPTHLRCRRVRPQDNPSHQGIVLDEIFVYMPIEAGRIKAIKIRRLNTSM